jgi:WD40 repeat protein
LTEGPRTRIGPYKLLQQIGEGGMGVVYMAEQEQPVQRRVALKIIKAGMDSADVIARFEQERQALAMMDHPNIARVLDAGATETGRPYFVMELVKGIPITRYCDQEHLNPRERLELFIPVCHAVQHAHQKGIIHRDLKPSNVMIALYDGRPVPKVIDFGVAKATSQRLTERTMFTALGQIIGTLEYMAPEQAELNNLDIDTRADIYSLGVILYELLTGAPPFSRQQLREAAFTEMLRLIREVEPPRPSTKLTSSAELPAIAAKRKLDPKKLTKFVHGDLDWIVMKALEKDRGRRYDTANSLALDIQRFLHDEPVLAGPPAAGYRLRKFLRRHKKPVITGALVVLTLVAGVVASTWQAVRATRAEVEAQGQRDAAADARDDALRARGAAEESAQVARRARDQEEIARRAAEADRDAKLLALQRADGLRLSAEAATARHFDPVLALLLSVEAVRRVPNHLTYYSLYRALQACREQRTVYSQAEVRAARFVPGGRLVLSVSDPEPGDGGTARVWDTTSGRLASVWKGGNLPSGAVDISGDGKRVAGALKGYSLVPYRDGTQPDCPVFMDRVVYLWDTNTGKDVVHLRGHDDRVVSVRFSPDNKKLVTASWDHTARLWDAQTGRELFVLKGHEQSLLLAAFSPDGRRVATVTSNRKSTSFRGGEGTLTGSGEDKLARIWDADTGREIAALTHARPGYHLEPTAAAFSPDGRRLVIAFADRVAAVWDAAAGGNEKTLLSGHEGVVNAVSFSPDGKRLATASADQTVRLWDSATARELLRLRGHEAAVQTVAFSPDGSRLLTTSADRTARLWDAASGLELTAFKGHLTEVRDAAFSPDGSRIVTAGDTTTRLWTTAPPADVAMTVPCHQGPLSALAFSPDGKLLLTAGPDGPGANADGSARLWEVATGKPALAIGQGRELGEVRSARFSDDGRRVLTASANTFVSRPGLPANAGAVHIWDARNGNDLVSLTEHETGALAARASRDGTTVLTVSDGYVRKITDNSSFSKGSQNKAGAVRVWDAATGDLICTLSKWAAPGFTPVFSPDGRRVLAIARDEPAAYLFDATSGIVLLALQHSQQRRPPVHVAGRPAVADRVSSAAISPDGGRVATAGSGEGPSVRVWDAADGQLLATLNDFEGEISFLTFTPDGRAVLTLSKNRAALWDPASGRRLTLLAGHEGPILSAAFSPDGKLLLTGSEDKTAALWDVAKGRMLALYRGHPGPVRLVAIAADCRHVATASSDGSARTWPTDLWPSVLSRLPRKFTAAERERYEIDRAPIQGGPAAADQP